MVVAGGRKGELVMVQSALEKHSAVESWQCLVVTLMSLGSGCRLVSDTSPNPRRMQKGCSAFPADGARCTCRHRTASLALLWAQLHLLSRPMTHTD